MGQNTTVLKNFFALEGLDGSGTTTQLNLLNQGFSKEDPALFLTCEPTDNPIGRVIRKALHQDYFFEPETLARLFSADRYEHLHGRERGILAALKAGKSVVTDRYLFSSLAYQTLESSFELILELNPFPLPEKVFFLDLPPEVCRSRREDRGKEELFDGEVFQDTIRRNYYRAFDFFSATDMELVVLDGTRPAEEINKEISKFIPS